MMRKLLAAASLLALTACAATSEPVLEPLAPPAADDNTGSPTLTAEQAARVEDLLSRMTLERKVAQLVMPDISSVTPADVERYRFGTILNGGNSGPYKDDLAPAPKWLQLADEFWEATTKPLPDGEPSIPILWAADAMHGHSNIVGATIFPHNVGLGATRDPDLLRRIGETTAEAIRVTGQDWTFAPTVAVARDDRWGRAYESYSENPTLVTELGTAMVVGLQGPRGSDAWLGPNHVISTAKHFFGDGGTGGIDQGDTVGDLDELKAIHAAPYPSAIDAGVLSIMSSFSSINGEKLHHSKELLTDYLRGDLGFGGLVVGDWNGHGQRLGCTNADCPASLMAGLDVYMTPEDAPAMVDNLVADVHDGTLPMARVDEAVRRVLTVKMLAGHFDQVAPSKRPLAGEWGRLGSPESRALAREAVAKSMVLLKNDGVLPFKAGANLLVAGEAADDVARVSGGWTLSWQGGGDLTNANFPGSTSLYAGIAAAAAQSGGSATLSVDGSYDTRPDAAIVVFGEKPYAEFVGDRKDLVFRDEEGLALLRTYREAGIPTVAVFITGRPLWVNRELNLADAFVSAWLPGSEGAGVADTLFGAKPFSGRLSFSWPGDCRATAINAGDEGILFPYGYGLSGTGGPGTLDETCSLLAESGAGDLAILTNGKLGESVSVIGYSPAGSSPFRELKGDAGAVRSIAVDANAQEDARRITFEGEGAVLFTMDPVPSASEGNELVLSINYLVDERPEGRVLIGVNCDGAACEREYDITSSVANAAQKGSRGLFLSEACLAGLNGSDTLALRATGKADITISGMRLSSSEKGVACVF
ncbi:glycoside hydrolase family 3 protein [Sphingomicrobium nitratireducens]|uniref:glycoside hydrolase family 3 protein n=1 Tax=Sphingomicrobium nitratireducens TaxID=2964666 RepID=UPI00223F749C|nr:glycoside hydrolase family 3 N-terminal domain-containing protein [Sphingomicrobium nitratireducens]